MTSDDVDETLPECQDGFDPGIMNLRSNENKFKRIELNRLDEFATQTCFNGRYGSETESEQFGAILKVNTATPMINMSQTTMIRLSNVEVNSSNTIHTFLVDFYVVS